MSFYTSAGGGRRRSGRTGGTSTANRQFAAADKAEQAQILSAALQAVLNVHREQFSAASPPIAAPPPAVDIRQVLAKHTNEAKAATSVFARGARKAALAEAQRRTNEEVALLAAQSEQRRSAAQGELNKQWDLLLRNDPATVLATLGEAFEDNDAAAAAVGVDDDEVTLLVIIPSADSIPERRPTTTPAGNLSLKKFTKRETADLYKLLACGHSLVTVKEALAVAPGLRAARVVAVRASAPDANGGVHPEVMLAARFERDRLSGVQWDQADAVRVVSDASSELVFTQKGATREFVPIDIHSEPELAKVVDAVDFEDLLQGA